MKKAIITCIALIGIISGCATVQSIVRSTFPYTANFIIPASTRTGTTQSATSTISSVDQIFTGKNNSGTAQQLRIASARIDAVNPSSQSLGVINSVRVYLIRSNGSGELLIASRNDVSSGTGNSLVLDIDNSRFLDDYMNDGSARIRMDYVLRQSLNADVSVRASLSFSTAPTQ
ncbi:MAG TPA: hypothetical protein VNI52_05515 [Sphingobacteriaceae bacterium]|nr:hypothetical protein [Sphingobacteriaceae bacterium]